ncbi:MAG TPA: L,D-transpeptidase [Gaiellaceae bacterium]|nr:L,D-transpeptidase [Gaiellaceae bacterium]
MRHGALDKARAGRAAAVLVLAALLGAGCGAADEPVGAAAAPRDPRVEPPISRPSVAPYPANEQPAAATAKPKPAPRARPAAARPAVRCASPRIRPLRTRSLAFAAVVRSGAQAYARPHGQPLARFARLNVNGVPTVFGVLGRARCDGDWLRVQLPKRPNGILGWVRARDVELVRVRTRIEVDLSTRRVTLYRAGAELLSATAAIGAADTPTPTGSYYVDQRLVAPNPEGPFGPAAIGISAFSPVLQHWAQGGPIAIHGTNQPDLIGGAVSHGCVRVRNDVLVRMFRLVEAGTPVVIRA